MCDMTHSYEIGANIGAMTVPLARQVPKGRVIAFEPQRIVSQILSANIQLNGLGTSQCVAVCCSVLQCVAVCCSVLQCAVVCCSMLQCAVVCCSMLQCAAVCCSVLQCVAVCCSVLQCVAVC